MKPLPEQLCNNPEIVTRVYEDPPGTPWHPAGQARLILITCYHEMNTFGYQSGPKINVDMVSVRIPDVHLRNSKIGNLADVGLDTM